MYSLIIVEDEEFSAYALSKVLDWESCGFSLKKIFTDSVEALEYLKHEHTDAVLTDISMPVVSGIEIARYCHYHSPNTMVVFLSAYSDFEYAKYGIQYKIFSYLNKPVMKSTLLKTLSDLCTHLNQISHKSQFINCTTNSIIRKCFIDILTDNANIDAVIDTLRDVRVNIDLNSGIFAYFIFEIPGLGDYLKTKWSHGREKLIYAVEQIINAEHPSAFSCMTYFYDSGFDIFLISKPGISPKAFGQFLDSYYSSINELLRECLYIDLILKDKLITSDISELNGKAFSEYSIPLNHFPGDLVYTVPKSSFSFFSQAHFPLIVLFIITAIALTVFLSIIISRKQYESILTVISAIESPYIGNTPGKNNPLYEMMESDSNSVQISDNFEHELVNKITNLKKAQLIALQTQINPHFLFNTLNMISYSVIVNNDKDTEAVHMISLLSDILKHSLKSEAYIIPLSEELEVLKSYTAILELRHGHTFDIIYDVAPDALNTKTFKSILQPLIENSIKHGIKQLNKKRRGFIKIKIYTNDKLLFMEVIDNGVGIEKEKLEELEAKLNSDVIFKNKSIGLNNVISRVKLLFGDNGGFKIKSDERQTTVTIYHPIVKISENNTQN